MTGLRCLRLRAARHVEGVALERLRHPVEQIRTLEKIEDVVGSRGIGNARAGTDCGEIVVGNVGDGEAIRGGGSNRERETAATPAREAAANRVHGVDVQSRREEQLEELRELGFRHTAEWPGGEAGRAP